MTTTADFNTLILEDRRAVARGRWRKHDRIARRISRLYCEHRADLPTNAASQALLHNDLVPGIAQKPRSRPDHVESLRVETVKALIREERKHLAEAASARTRRQSRKRIRTFATWLALS